MARLLKPQGRLYVFYNPWLETPPAETVPGQILEELGYAYEAEDLTAANRAFWRRMSEVLPGLEQAFMAEGNRFLSGNRQAESVGDGMKTSRYLYSVRPSRRFS